MRLVDFHFDLPDELIAQEPLAERSDARMLVVDRQTGQWQDRVFRDLPQFLRPGDCLVLNETKVFPSRLYGTRLGLRSLPVSDRNPAHREFLTGQVQVFLAHMREEPHTWEALVRPGRKVHVGEEIVFSEALRCTVIGRGEHGVRTVRFTYEGDFWERLTEVGHTPLPPYIKRNDTTQDTSRYQTVFARHTGSAAAPTAGLHFTPEVMQRCTAAGAQFARVTLHVGLGTFQPLREEEVEQNRLHAERFRVESTDAAMLASAQRRIAIGTTSVRTLETVARRGGWQAMEGDTDLFLYPGQSFLATDAMLTNFHLPSSSLLILVCAFAGRELVLAAYDHAVREGYRFFSYGDCMLIL